MSARLRALRVRPVAVALTPQAAPGGDGSVIRTSRARPVGRIADKSRTQEEP
jgi:hypothetical protein